VLFFTRIIRPIMGWMTTSMDVVPQAAQRSEGRTHSDRR